MHVCFGREEKPEREYLRRIILVNGKSSNTLLIKMQKKFASEFSREQVQNTSTKSNTLLSKFVLPKKQHQLPHTYPQIL